jgi:hypothetical protein
MAMSATVCCIASPAFVYQIKYASVPGFGEQFRLALDFHDVGVPALERCADRASREHRYGAARMRWPR